MCGEELRWARKPDTFGKLGRGLEAKVKSLALIQSSLGNHRSISAGAEGTVTYGQKSIFQAGHGGTCLESQQVGGLL